MVVDGKLHAKASTWLCIVMRVYEGERGMRDGWGINYCTRMRSQQASLEPNNRALENRLGLVSLASLPHLLSLHDLSRDPRRYPSQASHPSKHLNNELLISNILKSTVQIPVFLLPSSIPAQSSILVHCRTSEMLSNVDLERQMKVNHYRMSPLLQFVNMPTLS